MNATAYLKKIGMTKKIEALGYELAACKVGTGLMVVVTLLSPLTGQWECTVASLVTLLIPLFAASLVRRQIDENEERVFQLRLEHSRFW
jgi:hypothetical protein